MDVLASALVFIAVLSLGLSIVVPARKHDRRLFTRLIRAYRRS